MSEALNLQSGPWGPVLGAEQASDAVAVAQTVADRLLDPEQFEAASLRAMRQTAFPESATWEPQTVAHGFAGLALAGGYLDACFPGKGWDGTGHRYLELAGRGAEQLAHLPTGVFAGLSGLAFAAWSLSRDGTRYQNLLTSIEGVLLPRLIEFASALHRQNQAIPVDQFDVISGLTGVGAYLLCRRENQEAAAALRAVLRGLVALTKEEEEIPRWHTPSHLIGDKTIARLYPDGYLDCGLAHGIPGPLALMALALRYGVQVEGLTEAIERVASWLDQNRMDDNWGVNWPTAVPLAPSGVSSPAKEPSRSAWCYGSPGVARSLWLVGEAIGRSGYRELAVNAMEAVYRRPLSERRIDSPTFCHGVAGLLQITLRFAHDTGLPLFTAAARTLSEQLLSFFDADSLLGYCNLEPGGQRVEQPGLLDGALGVVLVLLAAATDMKPTWDRIFLLA